MNTLIDYHHQLRPTKKEDIIQFPFWFTNLAYQYRIA